MNFDFCHSAPRSSSVGTSNSVPTERISRGAPRRSNSSRITRAFKASGSCPPPPCSRGTDRYRKPAAVATLPERVGSIAAGVGRPVLVEKGPNLQAERLVFGSVGEIHSHLCRAVTNSGYSIYLNGGAAASRLPRNQERVYCYVQGRRNATLGNPQLGGGAATMGWGARQGFLLAGRPRHTRPAQPARTRDRAQGRRAGRRPVVALLVLSFRIGPIGPIVKDRTAQIWAAPPRTPFATYPAQNAGRCRVAPATAAHHPLQELFDHRGAGPTPAHQGAPNSDPTTPRRARLGTHTNPLRTIPKPRQIPPRTRLGGDPCAQRGIVGASATQGR